MSDRGQVEIKVVDAEGNDLQGDLFIQIQDENERVLYAKIKRYEVPVTFTNLKATPHGRHLFHVKSSVHCPMSCYVNVNADQTTPLKIPLLIDSDVSDRNGPRIPYPTRPDALVGMGAVFANPFHSAIQSSPDFQIPRSQGPNGGMEYYDQMVKNKNIGNNHRRLGCLFNLHRKMTNTAINASENAWSLIESIFAVEQDRLWAQVRPMDMDILFGQLEQEFSASEFHNIPTPEKFSKHHPTYKSTRKDKTATLQLSFAFQQVSPTEKVWIVDVDIDEKSGWSHFFGEAFPHLFTGGKTHPYVVHQVLSSNNLKPEYDLVVT